jgi:hypothetical protein
MDSHLATLLVVGWDLDSCLHASFRPISYSCCLAIKEAPAIPCAAGCRSGMLSTASTNSCAKFLAGSWNPSRAYDAPQNVLSTRMLNAERACTTGILLVECLFLGAAWVVHANCFRHSCIAAHSYNVHGWSLNRKADGVEEGDALQQALVGQ